MSIKSFYRRAGVPLIAPALLCVAHMPCFAASVAIDGSRQFQTIDGFGVNANVASWNDGELRPALDMLVDQLRATLWRVVIDDADWEATNDDADPATFNWTYYNGSS